MDEHDRIGRFETVRLLGRGGMGEVYLARDPLIDRLVAVKLLSAAFDGASRDRFTREARAAGRLAHDNVVTVFDVGEHRDRPFIAMEYVPGETLGALMRRRPPPPRGELLRLIQDACSGLAYAHRSGVVHLDVKPENLIRRDDGRLKILDFGLARVVAADETHTRHSAGTLRYMSPEQLNGGNVDHRSDVFAIGCVLFEMLTGQPAFGSTWPDVLARLNAGWVPTPSAVVPHLHPALERMTTRALAIDPSDRYQDLGALATELAMLRRDLDLAAPHDTGSYPDAMAPAPVADPKTVPLSHPFGPRTDPPASDARNRLAAAAGPSATAGAGRSRAWWTTAAAVAVIAVASSLWFGWQASQGNAIPSSAAPGAPAVESTPAPAATADLPAGPSQPAAIPKAVGPAAAAPATAAPSTIRSAGRGDVGRPEAVAPSVWQAVARRDYPTALRLLRAQPDQSTALVGELAATARAASDASRRLAEARGGTVRQSEGYRAGVAALARADTLDASGPSIDGLAARWEASDAFARAVPLPPDPPQQPMTGAAPVPAPPGPSREPEPSPPPPTRDVAGTLPPPDAPMPAPPPSPEAATPGTPTRREPPAGAPAAPTAAPEPVTAVTAEAGVRAALAAYEAAYDAHDVAALRAVYSGLSADQAQALTRTFADAVSYRLDLRVVDVAVAASSATATCVITHALVPKVGSPSRTTQTATFQFAPAGAGWVITRITTRR